MIYRHSADAFIIVYSITDEQSFGTARDLFKYIRQFHGNDKVPIVLLGNKTDVENQRSIPRKEGRSLAFDFSSDFHEVSAARGYSHVTYIFHELAKNVLRSRKQAQKTNLFQSVFDKIMSRRSSCSSFVIASPSKRGI